MNRDNKWCRESGCGFLWIETKLSDFDVKVGVIEDKYFVVNEAGKIIS